MADHLAAARRQLERPAPPAFQVYRRQDKGAWVRVARDGKSLGFSAGAWALLGAPPAVVFLVAREHRMLGFRPAADGDPDTSRVSAKTHIVAAGPVLRLLGPVRPGRYELLAGPGLPPHINLADGPCGG